MDILVSYEIQGEDHLGRSRVRDEFVRKLLGGVYVGGSAYLVTQTSLTPRLVRDTIIAMLGRQLVEGEWVVVVQIADAAWANYQQVTP